MKRQLRILYAWEWGGGSSHLQRFSNLASRLTSDGHHISVVAKNLAQVHAWFPNRTTRIYQAPTLSRSEQTSKCESRSLATIAWNLGYDRTDRVTAWLSAWLQLFETIQPDLVVGDFGLLPFFAANANRIPVVRIGVGYECAPKLAPLAKFTIGDEVHSIDQENVAEQILLHTLNRALKFNYRDEIANIADVIPDSESTLLCTVEELDPYANARSSARYLGWWDSSPRPAVQWPHHCAKRAIAYLKPTPGLAELLQCLNQHSIGLAIVSDGLPETLLNYARELGNVVQNGQIDFNQAARNADFAITSGNLGATFTALANGCPVLALPNNVEQWWTSLALDQLKLGICLSTSHPNSYSSVVPAIFQAHIKSSVKNFQAKYESQSENAIDVMWEQFTRSVAHASNNSLILDDKIQNHEVN